MTSKHISDQINTIRIASKKANSSHEAALSFLTSAGIIPGKKSFKKTPITATGNVFEVVSETVSPIKFSKKTPSVKSKRLRVKVVKKAK